MASLMRYSRSIGPYHGSPVAVSREGRKACALELNVAQDSIAPSKFSEKDRATITQPRHEHTELMSRISHRDRVCVLRQLIAGEH